MIKRSRQIFRKTALGRQRFIRMFLKRAKAENRDYIFSFIIPVYNTEDYVAETIDSIVGQKEVFKYSQIVLINDGSTDSSEQICLDYVKRYPKNIKYIKQDNQGVSAARNNGIDNAGGYYLNFIDSDDKWDEGSLYQTLVFLNKFKMPDVVAAKEVFFEAQTGEHPRNYIFKTDRMVDLSKEYTGFPIAAPQSFYKYSAIGDIRFKVGLKHSEDARFSCEVLLKSLKYGAMSEPVYLYRKRADDGSSSNNITYDSHYYTDGIEMYHEYIIERSKAILGKVPGFVQYAIAYNLGWRFKDHPADKIDAELLINYKSKLRELLQSVDDEIIADQRHINMIKKLDMLSIKHDIPISKLINSLCSDPKGNLYSSLEDKEIFVCKRKTYSNRCKIEFFNFDNDKGTLLLEGTLLDCYLPADKISFNLICNDELYVPELYPKIHNPIKTTFEDNDIPIRMIHFRQEIPLHEKMEISAFVEYARKEETVPRNKMRFVFGNYAYLNQRNAANYCIKDNHLLYYRKRTLYIETSDQVEERREELEREYRIKLEEKDPDAKELIEYRQYALDHLNDETKLWLFTDRMTSAEDSGEELFRHILEHPIDNVEPAFLIRKDVPDYERVKQFGKVIAFGTDEHIKAMLRADKLISAGADGPILQPFGRGYASLKDLIHYDFVFLQHGVIKDDLSGWLHRANKNIKLFVTSAEREKDSILQEPYGYTEDEVILTGLPRFDKLKRADKSKETNSIFVMPTWRQWLAPKFDINAESLDGIQTRREGFTDSSYFKFYNELLSNDRLHRLLEDHDYHLYFALHPRMGAEMDSFYSDERVHLLKPESFVYGDAFNSLRLLITDYSSVAFNVALMKKPVIYTQFDYDDFYKKGLHTSMEGYFSYENDGFGPVVKTVEQTVDSIEKSFESSFKLEKKYEERIDEFFFWPEEGKTHCELVIEHIMAL